MTTYFVAPDASGDETIWRTNGDRPMPMLRLCDIPPEGREIWLAIVAAMTELPRLADWLLGWNPSHGSYLQSGRMLADALDGVVLDLPTDEGAW